MMLAIGLSYIVFLVLRNIPSIPSFFSAFIMKGCWILLKTFLHLLRGSCSFCPCFCLCAVLHLWIYICWHILTSLEWNWLGQGVWSFWCVVGFCLPVFCREYLYLYSWKYWSIILFIGYTFIRFWNEYDAGFIEWVW
jgi:hypothetical protein